ncbi:MAG: ABC transporter permease [Bacteroidales bacterium]|nr:ABC transporter permease [Bacteroidales bacterium]
MKRFFGFVIKEFHHILRDPRSLIILFALPVVMIVLFGFIVTNEIRDVNIACWDRSKDEMSQELIRKILSSEYFSLSGTIMSDDEIEEVFRAGEARVVLVIEKNFESSLMREGKAALSIIADASDANSAQLVMNYLQGVIRNYLQSKMPSNAVPGQIEIKTRMYYNEEMRGVHMFVPGLMALILILISTLMTSVTITREKEFGTMELLLASPLKPREIILGKITPYILLSFINAITIIFLGKMVFNVPIVGSLFLLLIESLIYTVMALSIGVFISTVAKTQQIAMVISMVGLMLPTILLSGFIFPIDNMPAVLQWLSMAMPARWFIVIIKDIMLKGSGLLFVWKETLILSGMAALFVFAAVRRFKIRLD